MRITLFLTACVACTLQPLGAQTTRSLSLESAVQLALEKNVGVIQARNNVEAQQSATKAAYGALLPSVNLGGAFSRQQNWSGTVYVGGVPFANPSGAEFSAGNVWSSDISARVTLFNGFANTSNVSRTQSNATASEHFLSRTEHTTIYQTHQLYLNVVRTYQLLKVNEDNLKRSRQQLERINESNKVGAVALADVYRQQVQVGSDELALINAQSGFEKAKADLVAYLGVELDAEYAFDLSMVPSNIDTAEFGVVNARYSDFNGLVLSAKEHRPDYLASLENLNSAGSSVTIARSGHLPVISASSSYGYRNSELSNLTRDRSLDFSLSLSLPIFNGFSIQNQVEQAEIQRKNSEEDVRQSNRQLAVDIRKALLDLEASEKQVTVTQTSITSAEMDRKIADEKYSLGAGTLLDNLVANANYTNALSNKVNAVINYLLAKKQVEYALGTISK